MLFSFLPKREGTAITHWYLAISQADENDNSLKAILICPNTLQMKRESDHDAGQATFAVIFFLLLCLVYLLLIVIMKTRTTK